MGKRTNGATRPSGSEAVDTLGVQAPLRLRPRKRTEIAMDSANRQSFATRNSKRVHKRPPCSRGTRRAPPPQPPWAAVRFWCRREKLRA
jgi:hypothetical protein